MVSGHPNQLRIQLVADAQNDRDNFGIQRGPRKGPQLSFHGLLRDGPPKGADAGPGAIVEFRGGEDTTGEGNQGPPVRSLSLAVDPALMVRLNDRRDHAIWDLGDQPVARRRPRPGLAGHIGFRQDADVMQPGGQPESDEALFR